MRDLVGDEDQSEPDSGLEETCRGAKAPLLRNDGLVVNIRIENFRRLPTDGLALEDVLLEADAEPVAQTKDEQQYGDRPDSRQGDVP